MRTSFWVALTFCAVGLGAVLSAAENCSSLLLRPPIPIEVRFLSREVKNPQIREIAEYEFELLGILPGNRRRSLLGSIMLGTPAGPNELKIDWVFVKPAARELGVATALYDFAIQHHELSKNERIYLLTGTPKSGNNLEAILKSLIVSLSIDPEYRVPNSTLNYLGQFVECCAHIHKRYPDLILAAVEGSPSVRIGRKFGFSLKPESISIEASNFNGGPFVSVNFSQFRTDN